MFVTQDIYSVVISSGFEILISGLLLYSFKVPVTQIFLSVYNDLVLLPAIKLFFLLMPSLPLLIWNEHAVFRIYYEYVHGLCPY